MGGDFAPQRDRRRRAPRARASSIRLTRIQLVGRTAVMRARSSTRAPRGRAWRARGASRSHRRSSTRPTSSRWPTSPAPCCERSRTARWPSACKLQADGQVRRVRLRRQHRRADGRVDGASSSCTPGSRGPPSPPSFPTARKPVVVLDSGANVDCSRRGARPVRAARRRLRRMTSSAGTNPGVGLLSIGEEPEKGNAVVEGSAPAARGRRVSTSSATSRGATSRRRAPTAARSTSWSATGSSATCVLKFYEAVAPMMIGAAAQRGHGSPSSCRRASRSSSTTPSTAARRCSA